MARIKATCPSCGDVELSVPEVSVRLCTTTGEGEYRFDCPECHDTVERAGAPKAVELLVAAGVSVEHWSFPVERVADINAPRIGYDDLIEFHLLLNDASALAESLGQLLNEF